MDILILIFAVIFLFVIIKLIVDRVKRAKSGGAANKVKKKSIMLIVITVVLATYAVSLIAPMVWGLLSSFKDPWIFEDNVSNLTSPYFMNYVDVFEFFNVTIHPQTGDRVVGILEMYFNSILYCLGSAFFTTLTPCIVAYVVAKFGKKFRFFNIYTSIVIICMTIPIVGSVPSQLQVAHTLGLTNSIVGMWIMKSYFLGMYYLVFIAAFNTVPGSIFEAARIDGASNFRVFLSMMLPMVKHTFFTIMLIKFIEFWNDYQTPLLFMPQKPTISLGLYNFTFNKNIDASSVPMQLTGCMLVLLPVLVVFLIFQDKILGNITMGGVKE